MKFQEFKIKIFTIITYLNCILTSTKTVTLDIAHFTLVTSCLKCKIFEYQSFYKRNWKLTVIRIFNKALFRVNNYLIRNFEDS